MNKPDIFESHKDSKLDSYWDNLVTGSTAAYKAKMIEKLVDKHANPHTKRIMDIGCGTCELIFYYQRRFSAETVTCIDYDKNVINQLSEKYPIPGIDWVVQDIFTLGEWTKQYDLIFLLDVLHEVYSFYGRPNKDMSLPVDHATGIEALKLALKNIAAITSPGGCIVITDNILCEDDVTCHLHAKNPDSKRAMAYFLKHYPTRTIQSQTISEDVIAINSRDLCVLLTQYNKIKNGNWDRWNVEKMETHQYFTRNEYAQVFDAMGFDIDTIIETPEENLIEWNSDFEVLQGLKALPPKRVTLLAKKRQSN